MGLRSWRAVLVIGLAVAVTAPAVSATAPPSTPGTAGLSTAVPVTSTPVDDGEIVPDDLPADPRAALSTEDGRWDVQAVLAVLATRIPLDGVTPDPALAALMTDEDLAEALLAVLDQLTEAQRETAEAFVFPGPAERTETFTLTVTDADIASEPVPAATEGSTPQAPRSFDSAPSGFVRRAPARLSPAEDVVGYIRTYFVRSGLAVQNLAVEVEHGPTSGGVLATALPLTDGRNGCKVRVSTNNVSASLANTLAHEAYHCVQFAVRVPLGLGAYNEPRWVMEGTPSWASQQVAPSAAWADGWYERWVSSVSPLTTRDYAAMGLYDTIDASSDIDMWRLLVELLSTDDPATVLKNRLSAVTLGHWGAQYFDDPALGRLFFFGAFDGGKPLVLRAAVTLGGPPKILTIPPMSSRAFEVSGLGGEGVFVLRANAQGIARVGADTFAFDANHPGFLCVGEASCQPCPEGGPVIQRVSGEAAAIGAASFTGGSVRVSLVARELVCAPTVPVSPGGANCIVGQWSSTQMVVPPVPDQISSIGGAGTLLDFSPDGTLIADFNGMEPLLVQFRGPDHGEIITTGTRFSGSAQTTYAVNDGNLDAGALDPNAIRIIATMEIDNVGKGPNVPETEVLNKTLAEVQALAGALGASAGPDFGQSRLVCDGNTLTMTRSTPTGDYSWTFERVR